MYVLRSRSVLTRSFVSTSILRPNFAAKEGSIRRNNSRMGSSQSWCSSLNCANAACAHKTKQCVNSGKDKRVDRMRTFNSRARAKPANMLCCKSFDTAINFFFNFSKRTFVAGTPAIFSSLMSFGSLLLPSMLVVVAASSACFTFFPFFSSISLSLSFLRRLFFFRFDFFEFRSLSLLFIDSFLSDHGSTTTPNSASLILFNSAFRLCSSSSFMLAINSSCFAFFSRSTRASLSILNVSSFSACTKLRHTTRNCSKGSRASLVA